MHFAYPPRKNSNAASFKPRSTRMPMLRRSRARVFAMAGLVFLGLIYLLSRPSKPNPWMASHTHASDGSGSSSIGQKSSGGGVGKKSGAWSAALLAGTAAATYAASGRPPTVVLVTVYDETNYHRAYLDTVRENRRQYAELHGYGTFSPRVGEYDLKGSPLSWTKVVAMRHALTLFPESTFFWYLDQDAFVMNMQATIEADIMAPAKLDESMIKDFPVVPPDSIIRTFAHLRGKDVDFVLTQDYDGISTSSFIIRNGEWARFFFETWFDPVYRSYNFQKAETHALEHIVQWHPTILSKMALVPQRTINAYSKNEHGAQFVPNDLSVRVSSCARSSSAVCETEAQPFIKDWREAAKTKS